MTNLKPLFFIAIFFLLFSLISAAEINFTKSTNEFNQGETLIAKITGNFLEPVTEANIFFYRGHVRIPMVYEISEMNDDFYIYALLSGKSQGNYSLSLENVKYMTGLQESEESIVKNFTINQNVSDFSLEPGFIISNNAFSINLQNLKSNSISIDIDTSDDLVVIDSLTVQSGELREVNFNLKNQTKKFSEEIKLSSANTEYSVPVFINSNSTQQITNGTTGGTSGSSGSDGSSSNNNDEEKFKFEPSFVNVSMSTDSESKRIIYIVNTGGTKVENLDFTIPSNLEPYVKIDFPDDLDEDAAERVEITISSGAEEKFIEGEIIAESENFTSELKLTLNFITDYAPPEGEQGKEVIVTTCVQLKGNICGEKEECSGETADTKDGVCCPATATCEEIKKSSTGKVIGWSIVVLVALLLLWFFKRYRRVRPKKPF